MLWFLFSIKARFQKKDNTRIIDIFAEKMGKSSKPLTSIQYTVYFIWVTFREIGLAHAQELAWKSFPKGLKWSKYSEIDRILGLDFLSVFDSSQPGIHGPKSWSKPDRRNFGISGLRRTTDQEFSKRGPDADQGNFLNDGPTRTARSAIKAVRGPQHCSRELRHKMNLRIRNHPSRGCSSNGRALA